MENIHKNVQTVNFKNRLQHAIQSPHFTIAITILIIINSVILGLETNKDITKSYGGILSTLDMAILILFTIELSIKFYISGFKMFKSGWNIFDFLIVSISWLPINGSFSIFRAIRILRILRLISVVPQIRRLVTAMGHSIPGMISVAGLLGLIFYIASLLATNFFGNHPDANMQEWFGTISASAYTLFQIMTLESWSMGVVRPTMILFPNSWMFFLPFIIITSFAVLNFFIGIIVDSMQIAQKLEADITGKDGELPATKTDIRQLLAKIEQLERQVKDKT